MEIAEELGTCRHNSSARVKNHLPILTSRAQTDFLKWQVEMFFQAEKIMP